MLFFHMLQAFVMLNGMLLVLASSDPSVRSSGLRLTAVAIGTGGILAPGVWGTIVHFILLGSYPFWICFGDIRVESRTTRVYVLLLWSIVLLIPFSSEILLSSS